MMWSKLPIRTKLFVAIAATVALVLFVMAGMVALSMRAGFSSYLLNAELATMEPLAEALEDYYEGSDSGWQPLTDPGVFHSFTRDHLRPPQGGAFPGPPPRREGRPPGPRDAAPGERRIVPEGRPLPPGPPPADPRRLGTRLALLDADGQPIAGALEIADGFVSIPLDADGPDGETVIGHLALAAPQVGVGGTDLLFLRSQYQTLAIGGALLFLLSAAAAFLLARQFQRPFEALSEGAKTLADGDYFYRMDNPYRDEFHDLVANFNTLAESLENAELAERQWLSDASHELQTPIAIMRARIEAIQDGVRPADDENLGAIHEAVVRLSRLVRDLNTLSRAREKELELLVGDENLSAIAQGAIDDVRGRFADAGLSLAADIQPEILLPCDPLRVRQLFDNILENARRYTESPGKVSLAVWQNGDGAVITLEDSAPGPPPEAFSRLFERFYRVEASRGRSHGGSGLGLAICRAIVEAHGGEITGEPSPAGGLKISIHLPSG